MAAGQDMRRAGLIVGVVLACCPMGSFGQGIPSTPITLTDKITHLDGVWILDPTRGVRSSCEGTTNNDVDQTVRISISPQGVSIESHSLKWFVPLDGSPTVEGSGSSNMVATAALDAGWLAITTRGIAPNGRGTTNVFREVYIAERRQIPFERVVNYDELTI